MADTYSLRFEIDASRAEAGAKKFVSAINSVNKSLDAMTAKAEAAFSKLLNGAASGGDFSKLSKDLNQLNKININPNAVKSINSISNAFGNLKAPSSSAIKNLTTFANTVPALLNKFNVSGSFADSINKIASAMASFKVPSQSKIESLQTFGSAIQQIAPALRLTGNFSGIEKLGVALGNFKAPSEKAVINLRAFFNALNNSGAKASISSSLTNGIINLSNSLGGMKAPSSTSVKNLRDFFNAIALFKPVSGTASITRIADAFSNFKGPTQAQTRNLKDFVTMLATLRVPTNVTQIAAYLEKIAQAANKAGSQLHNFRAGLTNINFGSVGNQAQGLTSNLRGLENAFSGTFQAASVFRTLIGSITLGTLSKAIYDANTNFNAFKSTMLAVNEGSLKATGADMRYVEDMANRLGQRVVDIQDSFGGFAVSSQLAGVSTENTRKVFEATITAMTVLHRSSDRTKLALLALEQMMSKGKVSSEELRRQLGEQLPGAVNLMARALGVTTAELDSMLKKGEVISSEALPKFAAEIQKTYGSGLASALKYASAQFNLLSNSINSLFIVIGQSGTMDALARSFKEVNAALSSPDFYRFASDFGQRTAVVIEKLGSAFSFLIKNVDTVVLALKGILALNIARFIQGFSVLILGSVTSTAAWTTNLGLLRVALTGVQASAAGAAATVGLMTRIGAGFAALGTGPIGAIVIALGTLAAAWYATKNSATEFQTVMDASKATMDRYRESLEALSTSQLVTEQAKVRLELQEIAKQAASARTEFENMMRVSTMGQQSDELETLRSQLSNVRGYLEDTGMTFDQFVKKIGSTKFNTYEAQELANAFISLQNVLATSEGASMSAAQKLEYLNNVMNGMSSSQAVAAMNNVASAASSMAAVVAEAAQKVVDARYAMNLSEAQSAMSKDFIKLAQDRKSQLDDIAASEGSLSEKQQLSIDVNNAYAKSYKDLTSSAEDLANITKQTDANKEYNKTIEKWGDGFDSNSRKITNLREQLKRLNEDTTIEASRKAILLANGQKELDEAIAAGEKKGKGGKKGGGGGATKSYDEATKSTMAYQKAQDLLERQLAKGQITQSQYTTELDKLKAKYAETSVGTNAFQASFEQLRNELMPSSQALTEFTKNQDILKQAFDQGKISGEEYLELLTRLQKKYSEARTGNSWMDGIRKGLSDLTKTSDDFVNDVAGAVGNAFGGLEDALTQFVTTGKFDFKSLADSILSDIARIVIRYMIIQPIIQALSSIMGGLGLGGFAGGGNPNYFPPAPNALGNAFNQGNVVPFAKGGLTNGSNNGIVSSPTLFEMSGNRTGLMGEAGPEAIMPLKRAADGSLGVQASGAVQGASSSVYVQPKVNISIENNGGNSTATTSTQRNANGDLDIKVILEQVKDAVAQDMSKGGTPLNRAVESRYNLNAAQGNKR